MASQKKTSLLKHFFSFLLVYPLFVTVAGGAFYVLFTEAFDLFGVFQNNLRVAGLLAAGIFDLTLGYLFWKHSYTETGSGGRLQKAFYELRTVSFLLLGLVAAAGISGIMYAFAPGRNLLWSLGIGFGMAILFPWLFRMVLFFYRIYRSISNPLAILPTGGEKDLNCPACGTSLDGVLEREVVRRYECTECGRNILTAPVSREKLDELWEQSEQVVKASCGECGSSIELPSGLGEFDIYCHRCDTPIKEIKVDT